MNLSLFIFKISPKLLFVTLGITWFQIHYLPSLNFLFILSNAVVVDLLIGVYKAWAKKEHTTSQGLRRTVSKLIQYGGFIIVGVLLLNISVGEKNFSKYSYFIDGSFVFIILIELLSICENLVEINPDSKICKYVIQPFMKLVNGRLK